MTEDQIDHTLLFDQIPVPRFVMERTAGGYVVVKANPKALQYFGKKEEGVIGHNLTDILDPENASHLLHSFDVALKKKLPVSIQSLPTFPGNFHVPGFWINPVKDKTGEIILIDVFAHPAQGDDTALERERDDALLLLTSIFEVSEVGIVVTDHNRRVVKVNDSFLRNHGWSRDELIGKDVTDIIAPEEQDLARRNYDEFIHSGIRSSGEMKLVRKNGAVVNTLFTTATLELSHKRRFQVTTVMDITLRKQMEYSLRLAKEQADAASQAKSSFLANMSHELRTPLNAIIGFSEMMVKETFGPMGQPKYTEYMNDIHMSAQHLLEIINEVLDMSKIEAGRVDLDEHEIDLHALILSVTRIMASRAFSSGLEIREHIPKDLPRLFADPRLVRQILINLITNALKYAEKSGFIDVTAKVGEHGGIVMMVQDDGVGIPKERIKEAMEPFGQIYDPRHAHKQGTGLGLPLARAMMKLHEGDLELESDEGVGTKVTISFPRKRIRYQLKEKAPSAGDDPGENVEMINSAE